MYTKDGENYFIVDAHIALWDARPENQLNVYGKQFIDCFFDYHRNLSPASELWSYEDYLYQGGDRLMRDIFELGHVDHAIFQPARLKEFYANGFGQTDEASSLAAAHPDKLTYNHYFDPRDGEAGLDQLRVDAERFGLKGVKLYTADWHGDSRGWRLDDPWAYRYFELCRELGIKNVHVHKGPTIRPLDRDAFDVADVDHVATDFTDLNFIVEHVGLPRLEDFCWIATQEPNVYGGLAVAMPFIHSRPRYFAQIMGELLYWIGEDRIFFSSDYALWTPRWLVESFVDFQIPEDLSEYAPITTAQKKKILGLNAAKVYDLEVPAELRLPDADETATGPRGADEPSTGPATWWAPDMTVIDDGVDVHLTLDSLRQQAFDALAVVLDPELDEPITDLGFVRSLTVRALGSDLELELHLRLPTSFCSPNFAYLMASDSKDVLVGLPWTSRVVVELADHHDSELINSGLAADAGYLGTFGHEAEQDLEELRATFRRKAHAAAMERALTGLLRSDPDRSVESLVEVTLADLPTDRTTDALLRRRAALDLPAVPEAPVFVDHTGRGYAAAEVPLALRRARSTRVSIDGNAHFCRGLLRTRYTGSGADQSPRPDGAEAADAAFVTSVDDPTFIPLTVLQSPSPSPRTKES